MPPTKRRKNRGVGRGGKVVAKGGVKKGARVAAKKAAKGANKINMERILIKPEEVSPAEENTDEVLAAYDSRVSAPYADMPALGMGELTEAQDLRRQLDHAFKMMRTFEKQAALDKRVTMELCATKERLMEKDQELAGIRSELEWTREELKSTKETLEKKGRLFEKACKESKTLLLRAEFAEAEHHKLIDQKPEVAKFEAITQEMQTRIDEATAEVAAVKKENALLKDNIATLKKEKNNSDAVLAKLKKEHEDWKSEKKDKYMRKAEGAVFKGAAEMQQEVDRLRRERNKWQDEAEREKNQAKIRDTFLADQAKLQKEKDRWQLDWAKLKKEYEKQEDKLKEVKKELKDVKKENELLRSEHKHEPARSSSGGSNSSSGGSSSYSSVRTAVVPDRHRRSANRSVDHSPARSSGMRTPSKSSRRD